MQKKMKECARNALKAQTTEPHCVRALFPQRRSTNATRKKLRIMLQAMTTNPNFGINDLVQLKLMEKLLDEPEAKEKPKTK